MADISKFTLPDGNTYFLKDETARSVANGKSSVSINRKTTSGTNIFDITIDGVTTQMYAPTSGGGSQVQSNWAETDISSVSYIQNKPTKLSDFTNDLVDKHPIGSIYVTETNSNPSSYLGGSWSLVDKEFKTENATASFTRNTTNTSSATITVNRSGHNIIYHGSVTFKVAISNTNLEVFTQTMSNNGASSNVFGEDIVFIGQCDSANAIVLMDMDGNGRVRTLNVVIRGTGTSVAANNTVKFDVIVPCSYVDMVDSFCNKFFWKRTS